MCCLSRFFQKVCAMPAITKDASISLDFLRRDAENQIKQSQEVLATAEGLKKFRDTTADPATINVLNSAISSLINVANGLSQNVTMTTASSATVITTLVTSGFTVKQ